MATSSAGGSPGNGDTLTINNSRTHLVVMDRLPSPDNLPPGQALLFLDKVNEAGEFEVKTAKLVQGKRVLQFGQFESNPGNLCLTAQWPENLTLPDDQKYGEKELLEDVRLALAKKTPDTRPVYPLDVFQPIFEAEAKKGSAH